MARTITLIPGDGIGPEISEAMTQVIAAAGADLAWDLVEAGSSAYERTGEVIPAAVHRSLRRNHVGLKGPTATPVASGHPSVNVALRKHYELFANIRPIQPIEGIASRYATEPIDLVIFRENTEGLYSGIEHTVVPGVVESLRIITAKASTRISRMAFDYAQRQRRKKVTVAHKANIMKLSDGLFLDSARRIAKRFPTIELEELIIDNCCMQLVLHPARFDVILLPNFYGDIVSDLCAGLVGGLGVTPGANLGERYALFEAVHGSAPDIAGRGVANPTALILSAAMMLQHLGRAGKAKLIRDAVANVLRRDRIRTRDLGGDATTAEYTQALVREVKRLGRPPNKRRRSQKRKTRRSA